MVTIINAKDAVLGRLCTHAAKKALLGEEVVIINAEQAIVSGKTKSIIRSEQDKLKIKNIGSPLRGPFHQRRADRYVRRAIRGMLPTEKERGRSAFKRVMVYIGSPKEEIIKKYKFDIEKEKVDEVKAAKKRIDGMIVADVCKFISGKNAKQ